MTGLKDFKNITTAQKQQHKNKPSWQEVAHYLAERLPVVISPGAGPKSIRAKGTLGRFSLAFFALIHGMVSV